MKLNPAAVVLLAGLIPVLAQSAVPSAPTRGLSIDDIITLSRTGIEASVIEDRIRALGLGFEPGPAERTRLAEAGVGAALVRWVQEWKPPDPAPASEPARHRETVRTFEEVDPAGRRVLVLTNLDETGEPIRDPLAIDEPAEPFEPGCFPLPAPESAPPRTVAEAPPPAEPPALAPVVVEVNVEVPPVYPGYFPYIIAGSPGGIYPTHLDFLGYGNDISKPSWFSGLGLNAANNFGHSTVAKPNNTGLDAFFGPPRP